MSLFRPGPVPAGVAVARPVWAPLAMAPYLPGAPVSEGPAASVAASPGAAEEVGEILRKARLQAAETLQGAAAEAEAAVEAARREGFDSGRREGLAAAEAEVESQRQQAQWQAEKARLQADGLRQSAEADARVIRAEAEAKAREMLAEAREEAEALRGQAREEQRRYLDEARNAVVELAVAAAVRLVQGHLAIQPAAVVGMVRAGLRRLKETDCTVRVSPRDLPLLEAQRSSLERELGSGSLTLQPDRSLSSGDFTVASPLGHVDGTVEQQAVHLRSALAAALGGD